jgi:hypothetical protein
VQRIEESTLRLVDMMRTSSGADRWSAGDERVDFITQVELDERVKVPKVELVVRRLLEWRTRVVHLDGLGPLALFRACHGGKYVWPI